MGAHINETQNEIVATAERLRGERIVFDLPTVTGTENILLAAVTADGRTEIFNAAREPHVQDLCRLLTKMGAQIEGIGTERLIVDGTHGAWRRRAHRDLRLPRGGDVRHRGRCGGR